VFVSEAGDAKEDRVLKQLFIASCEKEYGELEKRVQQLEGRCRQIRETPSLSVSQVKALERRLRQLEETFQDIRRVDFFPHPSGDNLEKQLKGLRLSVAEAQPRKEVSHKIAHHSRSEFRGKTWATRAHIHIDRLCSAWLIKRFIDPNAKFLFAAEERLPKNAILFDVVDVEFTHRGDRCTFETLLESFRLKDKALLSMAELVHEIDLKDQKYHRPESAGFDMIVRAISDSLRDDQRTVDLGSKILDVLYHTLSGK
jgi:molybdopterin converting factor small subunit